MTRGGNRGGRKPLKYGEETTPVVIRVPKSKVGIFRKAVKMILDKWLAKPKPKKYESNLKRNNMNRQHYKQYFLSTEGYYFTYRPDNYDSSIERATLFNAEGQRVDDVRVSAFEDQVPEMSHNDVIEYFEARIMLGMTKAQ